MKIIRSKCQLKPDEGMQIRILPVKISFFIFYNYGCYLTVTKTDAVLLEQNCKVDQLRLYDLKDIDDEVGRSSQCLL